MIPSKKENFISNFFLGFFGLSKKLEYSGIFGDFSGFFKIFPFFFEEREDMKNPDETSGGGGGFKTEVLNLDNSLKSN